MGRGHGGNARVSKWQWNWWGTCVCVCGIYVCMYVYMCLCVHACVQRPDVYTARLPQSFFTLSFENGSFVGLELSYWLDWLTSKLYGSSRLRFLRRCWGPDSGPCACTANTLLTEPSPNPRGHKILLLPLLFVCWEWRPEPCTRQTRTPPQSYPHPVSSVHFSLIWAA